MNAVDVSSNLDEQEFVWDSNKAAENALQHGVRFEQAREAFLDPLAVYDDASPDREHRLACLGLNGARQLLYVVHVLWENEVVRIISARAATSAEKRRYESE